VLCAGLTGQIAACCFQYGLPFLVPSFRAAGLSLTQASAMVSAPIVGVLCALVLWGAVADRLGERWVLAGGLAGAAGALMLAAAATAHPLLLAPLLCVAGASAACVHVVSGRLILGWFPPNERGLAMGLRQTGQPIGVGVAALALPRLGGHGLSAAMLVLAAGCALAALLIVAGVRDVRRATGSGLRAGSPYRGSYLWRVHAAGALMVVPQFGVAVFAYDYLVSGRGWSAGSAGALLAASQVFGAGSRLGSGWWSDHAGTRLGPMRTICLATAAVLGLLAIGAAAGWALAVAALAVASVITVSTNGLSFTAVAERAGQAWAGRALGVHNTGQNITAAVTPPLLAVLITLGGDGPGGYGYTLGFSCLVLFPLAAASCLPVLGERHGQAGRTGYAGPAAYVSPAAEESKPGSH
jgi:MFS family permease